MGGEVVTEQRCMCGGGWGTTMPMMCIIVVLLRSNSIVIASMIDHPRNKGARKMVAGLGCLLVVYSSDTVANTKANTPPPKTPINLWGPSASGALETSRRWTFEPATFRSG